MSSEYQTPCTFFNDQQLFRIRDLATTAARPKRVFVDSRGIKRTIKAKPAHKGLLPMGESTIWDKTKRGEFPKPIKLSERITVWKKEDVINWLASKEDVFAA